MIAEERVCKNENIHDRRRKVQRIDITRKMKMLLYVYDNRSEDCQNIAMLTYVYQLYA